MGVDSQLGVLVPHINAAFDAATLLEEQAMSSLSVDDLEAQLGELDGEVRVCACVRACVRECE